jgi:hypothetical protein
MSTLVSCSGVIIYNAKVWYVINEDNLVEVKAFISLELLKPSCLEIHESSM